MDYQTVMRFSRRVGRLQCIDSLLLQVQQIFREDLAVEYMDIWLLGAEHETMARFCQGELNDIITIPPEFAEHLLAHPAPVYADSSASSDYRDLLTDADSARMAVWVPLVDRGQAVGILGLGPRWTGEVYDDQDLQLIGILAQQMAISVLNARQLERLEATSRLIVQAGERERLKFARELHDTVLQFLLVLTYGLDDLKEQQAGRIAEIERWQERISTEADQLRSMLSYLRTPELLVQHGLVSLLRAWIDRVQQETSVSIVLDLADEVESLLSIEAKVAIYRVFREAVHNALKYAEASLMTIQLYPDGDGVRFSIQDDGKGYDLEQALQVGDKGYSNLGDMRAYIESLNGQWEIRSAMGVGTVVSGWVPAREVERPMTNRSTA